MLLNNVVLNWAKLDPNNPDMGYDKKSPQYSVSIEVSDKKDADAMKKAGINIKPLEADGKIKYVATLKKKIYKTDDGKNNTPAPIVVDRQLQPLDGTKIGNGSIGNVQVKFRPYEYMGKTGTSVVLTAIQVTDLKVYESGDSLEFQPIDTDKEVI